MQKQGHDGQREDGEEKKKATHSKRPYAQDIYYPLRFELRPGASSSQIYSPNGIPNPNSGVPAGPYRYLIVRLIKGLAHSGC